MLLQNYLKWIHWHCSFIRQGQEAHLSLRNLRLACSTCGGLATTPSLCSCCLCYGQYSAAEKLCLLYSNSVAVEAALYQVATPQVSPASDTMGCPCARAEEAHAAASLAAAASVSSSASLLPIASPGAETSPALLQLDKSFPVIVGAGSCTGTLKKRISNTGGWFAKVILFFRAALLFMTIAKTFSC